MLPKAADDWSDTLALCHRRQIKIKLSMSPRSSWVRSQLRLAKSLVEKASNNMLCRLLVDAATDSKVYVLSPSCGVVSTFCSFLKKRSIVFENGGRLERKLIGGASRDPDVRVQKRQADRSSLPSKATKLPPAANLSQPKGKGKVKNGRSSSHCFQYRDSGVT